MYLHILPIFPILVGVVEVVNQLQIDFLFFWGGGGGGGVLVTSLNFTSKVVETMFSNNFRGFGGEKPDLV
jgi:hypothetical protein